MSLLNLSLIRGWFPPVTLALAVLALAVLLLGRPLSMRGRWRWWSRRVPLGVGVGVFAAGALIVGVDVLWRPFPDPLPRAAVVWTGLSAAAFTLALLRAGSRRGKALALVVVLPVVLAGATQVNHTFGAFPTLRSALGVPLPGELNFAQLAPTRTDLVGAAAGGPLSGSWVAPANLPTDGAVATTKIPGTRSGFDARPAWIYVPPAYRSAPRAQLPVLILLSGQPGSPRDWFDGGRLAQVMDTFATAHAGLAPVVVVPDLLGSLLANPLCVDSGRGNVFTYLSVDVPAWIRAHLQIDPNPPHWAVGGYSSGGTCALQLAVNAPRVYPTFIDISGQNEPTLGDRARTIAEVFGGNVVAFTKINPLNVLAGQRFPDTAGTIVVGRDDAIYRPQAQQVLAATRGAGMDIRYLELPGGHSWYVWRPGLAQSLPWLASRTGLTP